VVAGPDAADAALLQALLRAVEHQALEPASRQLLVALVRLVVVVLRCCPHTLLEAAHLGRQPPKPGLKVRLLHGGRLGRGDAGQLGRREAAGAAAGGDGGGAWAALLGGGRRRLCGLLRRLDSSLGGSEALCLRMCGCAEAAALSATSSHGAESTRAHPPSASAAPQWRHRLSTIRI
jgi:hypothetical protein